MSQATLRLPGRLGGRIQISPALLSISLAPMTLIVIFVAMMFWVSFQKGIFGTAAATYTLDNYRELLSDPFLLRVIKNTVVFALASTAVALAIGLPIAWLVERTTLPAKTLVYTIMTLGLLIPGIYTAMGWTLIAHPRIGILNRWLVDLFGLTEGPINIATPVGMGFVQGLSLASLAFILNAQMFRAMNPSLEEAAKVHGMGFGGILRRITLPLALPGILAAVIYIVTIGIATFDIPAILGLGNRVYLLSTFIYLKVNPQGSGLPEYGITGAVGAFMIVIAGMLTLWYGQVLRQGHRFEVVTGKGYRPSPIDLRGWRFVAWGFIALYAFLSKLLPLLLIAYAALTPYFAPPSAVMFRRLSLVHFAGMDWELVIRGLKNTALLVAVVPLLVVLFAFCISWLVVRSRRNIRYILEFGAFLPHALPEVILAIGALLLALFVLGDHVPLYGSVWLIAIVYVIARLAFATRAINGSLLQIHRELEEAAFVAGLSNARTAARILFPLLRPALLSVWIWTALLVYRELTVAVFLGVHDNVTLPAVIWSYWYGGGINKASAVTLLMTLVLAPLILLFWWFGRRSQVSVQ
ncbi:MAG TPA: iron ABC transporter permease [candidate division Zixibacteria bacterium]|nr:iron ABC transporter permease [candidate division Zixibacteria bacterium]